MAVCGSQFIAVNQLRCVTWIILAANTVGLAEDRDHSVPAVSESRILSASRRIDQLIEAGYAKNNVKPNPLVGDEVFLRRVYLDIVGRIPTYRETKVFLDSTDSNKRQKLIDRLLDSEGYVSHHFNYWADLLRIQSRMPKARWASAGPFIEFVKQSLREHKPYDQFVRELITAEGFIWENGAVAYYIRDRGMPLDNMSNTAQVFLGTQLVCAQCHDHPYDSWTQQQYYQMAAYTYGVETYVRSTPRIDKLRKMYDAGEIERDIFLSAQKILQPFQMLRVRETDRQLRLPHDYQYDNAKPKSLISPKTLFGDDAVVASDESRAEAFARWMTSPSNPRFGKVIANRLWKRAMGVGLIEPVDDLKDGGKASNPELIKFLTELVVELDFDLRQFQRVLFNTKTYAREVSRCELASDEQYHFPGPLLRRMSAEQLWDSLLTLTILNVDERKSLARKWYYKKHPGLAKKSVDEILEMAKMHAKLRAASYEVVRLNKELYQQYLTARRNNDLETAKRLDRKMDANRRSVYSPELMQARREQEGDRSPRTETDPRWIGVSRDFVRASEVESPAPAAHFLRQFGQSDREMIENANTDASVPQILTLLNGPLFAELSKPTSVLAKDVASVESSGEKLDVIFLSILNRRATDRERQATLPLIESDRAKDVIWALLNTQKFMFVR